MREARVVIRSVDSQGGQNCAAGWAVELPAGSAGVQVMRRLQVQGRPGFPRRYSGGVDCVSQMLRKEGIGSFWRGSLSSWMKVVPSMAATR